MRDKLGVMLFITFLFVSCGSSVQMLPEPKEKGNLLIGSLIFNMDGYEDHIQTIWEDIDVAIIGRYVENGQLHTFSKWIRTDEYGYFFIPHVPDGEYAIKGFKVHLFADEELKIVNDLDDPENNYFELREDDEVIYLHGNLFDTKQNYRVINFDHNIFTLHRNGIVEMKRMTKLQELRLPTGEIVNSPPVPSYFLEYFKESGWEKFLMLQMK